MTRVLALGRRTFEALSVPNFKRYFIGQSISLVPPDGGINPCLVVVCGGWDAGSCGNVGTGQDVAGSVILDHWSTTPGDSVTMHFSSDASLGLLENQGGFQPLSVSGSFTAPVSAP